MHITVLGSRANIEEKKPYHARFSGILIDDRMLVDVGDRSFLEERFRYILFTHLHPDHAFFVETGEPFNPGVDCYAPEHHELVPGLTVISEKTNIGRYQVTPIPVIHSLKVDSSAYIIERRKKRLFITGDMGWIEKKHHERFGRLNLVIADGSWIRKGGMIRKNKKTGKIFGHTGVPDLVRVFREYTDHIVFSHLGRWFIKDVPKGRKALEKFNDGDLCVEPAYDGMTIKL